MDKNIQAQIIFNKWKDQKKIKNVEYIFLFFCKSKIPYSIAKEYVKKVYSVMVEVTNYDKSNNREIIMKYHVINTFKSIYKKDDMFEFVKKKEEQVKDYLDTFKTVF